MMKKWIVGAASAVCLAGAAHAFDLGSAIKIGSDMVKTATLSDSDVKQLASESRKTLDKQNKIAPASSAYSKRLARITKGMKNEEGMNLNFKVYLTKDINAFAMADGTVRVYSGLMDKMTDDEVRYVIGHEIGHVKLGHTRKAMQLAYGATAVRNAAAASGNGSLSTLSSSELGDFAEKLVNAQFSQSQESDADAYSVEFLKRHHYNTQAAVSALQKLAALGGNDSSVLASHPAPLERAAKVEKLL